MKLRYPKDPKTAKRLDNLMCTPYNKSMIHNDCDDLVLRGMGNMASPTLSSNAHKN
jgi:hypothetical protein